MDDNKLLELWKSTDKKLEESLRLNRQNAEDITKIKVRSFLASMKPLKLFTLLVGILWVGFVDLLIIKSFPYASPFFLVSAGIQVLLTKLAIGIYIYQLILIYQVDVGEPVIDTQENLARLKSSTLWVTRLLFLQLPVWTTFYINADMLKNAGVVFFLVQVPVSLVFFFIAIWLFMNIKYKNREKKWFRLIFSGREWDPVIQSMDLLDQIREYHELKG
jgi:hypothetical protein